MACAACDGTGKVLEEACPLCSGCPTSLTAKRNEAEEQRARADRAEVQVRKLLGSMASLKAEVDRAAGDRLLTEAAVGQLTQENTDLKMQVAQLQAQLQAVQSAVAAVAAATTPSAAPSAAAAPVPAPARPAAAAAAPALVAPAEDSQTEDGNKRTRRHKKQTPPPQQQQLAPKASPTSATEDVQAPRPKSALAIAAEERLAAKILAEQQRMKEEAAKKAKKGADAVDTDEEEDLKARKRVLREDREREARKVAARAAAEREEQLKREAAAAKKKQAQEERTRFSPEDFEALQALRGEVLQPEAEESPSDDDEEQMLEREMARAQKEAKELQSQKSFKDVVMQMQNPFYSEDSQEAIKQSKRKVLMQKLEAKKEMLGMKGKMGAKVLLKH